MKELRRAEMWEIADLEELWESSQDSADEMLEEMQYQNELDAAPGAEELLQQKMDVVSGKGQITSKDKKSQLLTRR